MLTVWSEEKESEMDTGLQGTSKEVLIFISSGHVLVSFCCATSNYKLSVL